MPKREPGTLQKAHPHHRTPQSAPGHPSPTPQAIPSGRQASRWQLPPCKKKASPSRALGAQNPVVPPRCLAPWVPSLALRHAPRTLHATARAKPKSDESGFLSLAGLDILLLHRSPSTPSPSTHLHLHRPLSRSLSHLRPRTRRMPAIAMLQGPSVAAVGMSSNDSHVNV